MPMELVVCRPQVFERLQKDGERLDTMLLHEKV